MTQDELAAGRFTKQYVSQIERGETVPSEEVLDWLAERLGVEPDELAHRRSARPRSQSSSARLADGERLLDEHRYPEALETFVPLRRALAPGSAARAPPRGRARRGVVARPARPRDRGSGGRSARGCPPRRWTSRRRSRTSPRSAATRSPTMAAAQVEFAKALELLDEAEEPNDRLRLDIHQWRSRCYRRQRDWEAAREDIDRALELVRGARRRPAQRRGEPAGVARRRAAGPLGPRPALRRDLARPLRRRRRHRHRRRACSTTSPASTTRSATTRPRSPSSSEAFAIFVDAHLEVGGRLRAQLARRDPPRAGRSRRGRGRWRAGRSRCSRDRIDHVQEIGTAQLVLARAHLEQGELEEAEDILADVDESYALTESVSHQARSWMARGELELRPAQRRRGRPPLPRSGDGAAADRPRTRRP